MICSAKVLSTVTNRTIHCNRVKVKKCWRFYNFKSNLRLTWKSKWWNIIIYKSALIQKTPVLQLLFHWLCTVLINFRFITSMLVWNLCIKVLAQSIRESEKKQKNTSLETLNTFTRKARPVKSLSVSLPLYLVLFVCL